MGLDQNQRMLKWLENEKIKDKSEIDINKIKFISEIKSLKKTDIFIDPKKLSLWDKIRIMILGT
jgi:hypothetical protein